MNEMRPEVYDETAAKVAFERASDFFKKNLS
jgi:hypothetical protein